jgi:hypothetical protein
VSKILNGVICVRYSSAIDTAADAGKTSSTSPPVDCPKLEPIAEEPSFMEDDQLNDSILTFQNYIQDDPEQQEISDSHYGTNSSDNEDDDIDMESDDEPLEKQLQRLMPWKNPQNAGQKKPGPKRSSSQQGDVDVYDPHTCGMYFLFRPYLLYFFSL